MTAVAQPERRVPRWWWLAAFLAASIAAYSLRFVVLGQEAYTRQLADSFRARPLTIAVHALFGPFALLLGLVNLLPAMRRRPRWVVHRWVGRIYLISTVILGVAGLSLAFHAAGGRVARAGFVGLALATLATSTQGYRFIRRRDVRHHREWMLRSYALIFAAVMLRIWMPLFVGAGGVEFVRGYRVVAWLCWVPNVLFAEWIIRRGWRPVYDAAFEIAVPGPSIGTPLEQRNRG